MKYIMFHNQYYTMAKNSDGEIILTPARGTNLIKAWARITLKTLEEQGRLRNVMFLRKDYKVFCLYHPIGSMGFDGTKWGLAICGAQDEFDYEIGKAISYSRMVGNEIPEFVFAQEWEI